MEVTVGERMWAGSLASGIDGFPYTVFVVTGEVQERFEPVIDEDELAEFSSFPLDVGAGDNTIGMKFRGNRAIFLQSGVELDSINPREIIVATGSITTGGSANTLAFAFDFDSIQVRDPSVPLPVPEPFVLNIETDDTTVDLSWETEDTVSYQLQVASGLEETDWMTVETIVGTGEAVRRSLARVDETRFYRLIRE